MYNERPALKLQARELIRQSRPRVLYASAIFVALSAVFSYLSSRILGSVSFEQLAGYFQYMQEGSYYYATNELERFLPSANAQLLSAAMQIMELFVGVGFTAFLYNTVRGLGAAYGNLLDGFGPYIRLVLLRLVVGIFIALWSLLFFFPAIIAAYSYSMAAYIMLDHPEYSIMQCIRESRRMTRGCKTRLFLLDLSMLGWLLLVYLPSLFGLSLLGYLALVWYQPYHDLCYLFFYDRLRAKPGANANFA